MKLTKYTSILKDVLTINALWESYKAKLKDSDYKETTSWKKLWSSLLHWCAITSRTQMLHVLKIELRQFEARALEPQDMRLSNAIASDWCKKYFTSALLRCIPFSKQQQPLPAFISKIRASRMTRVLLSILISLSRFKSWTICLGDNEYFFPLPTCEWV